MRGGTSKGIFVHSHDLPPPGASRDRLLLALLGSPDRTSMQLNGLGGGISSTSKVAVISQCPSESPFHVNYLFGQVSLTEPTIDWSSSCANLASAVGLHYVRSFLLPSSGRLQNHDSNNPNPNPKFSPNQPSATVYDVDVWQENLGQHLRISVSNEDLLRSESDFIRIPGVPGVGAPIKVAWVAPKYPGAPLLPTGNPIDTLSVTSVDGPPREVPATLLCGTNPTVFVDATALGLSGAELPKDIPYDLLLPLIDELRARAAEKMGIALVDGLRVCWVAPAHGYTSSAGDSVLANDVDILARITTPGRVHHAITGTGAANLSLAAAIPGTVPAEKLRETASGEGRIRIGHPGGVMPAEAEVEEIDGQLVAKTVGFYRTARWLLHGVAEVEVAE